MSFESEVLSDGPLAWWCVESDYTTDHTGNGNDLIEFTGPDGGTVSSSTPVPGGFAAVNASPATEPWARVAVWTDLANATAWLAVEAWADQDALSPGHLSSWVVDVGEALQTFFAQSNSISLGSNAQLLTDPGSTDPNNGLQTFEYAETGDKSGAQHQYVWVLTATDSGADGVLETIVYVDGSQISDHTETLTGGAGITLPIGNSNGNIIGIFNSLTDSGGSGHEADLTFPFCGTMASVIVYGGNDAGDVLTAGRVLAHFGAAGSGGGFTTPLHATVHVGDFTVAAGPTQTIRLAPVFSGARAFGPFVHLSADDPEPGLVLKLFRSPDFRTPVEVLTDARSRTWREEFLQTGTASFEIPNSSSQRDLVEPDDMVRFELNGRPCFCAVVTDDTSNTIDPGLEAAQNTTFNCVGLTSLLSEAIVAPANGFDAEPIETDRLFSWPAPQFIDTGWAHATALVTIEAADGGAWPLPIGGVDDHQFPSRSTMIIGPSSGSPSSAPIGTCYFRKKISVPTDGHYGIYVTADNTVEFFIDGQHIIESGDLTMTSVVFLDLTAGVHTFAASVFNGPQFVPPAASPTDSNPLGLAFALYTADAGNNPLTLVADTDSSWLIVEYPADPPGMTLGQVLQTIFFEAISSGLLEGWELTFDDVVDSNGVPWEKTGDISTKTGNDYRTFIFDELAQTYIDVRAQVGGLVLDAYNQGGIGTDTPASLHGPTDPDDPTSSDLTQLTHQRRAITATRLVVKWPGGWHLVDATPVDQRPKQALLELGTAQSITEVEQIARQELTRHGEIREAVTIGLEPIDDTDTPYLGFYVADRVTVPLRDGTPASEVVMAISLSENTEGKITWGVEIKDRFLLETERWENALKKLSDGTIRGDSRVATPMSFADTQGPSCCPPQPTGGG